MKYSIAIFLTIAGFTSTAFAEEIRHEVAVVDSPADDYLAVCGWEFDVEGGGYSTCSVDLDGDGIADQMFSNAGTSGTGGSAATVYLARKDGRFTRVGTIGHGGISSETVKTGGRLIHCSWSFGAGATSITTYLVSHDGLKKVMTIGGDHNDKEYQQRFKKVFTTSLEVKYSFVAARPKP